MAAAKRAQAALTNNRLLKMDYDSEKPALKEKSLMHTSNKKIFIGPTFQAFIPAELPEGPQREEYERFTPSHEILMWEPTDRISDAKLDALVAELKPRGFDEDQTLAFLRYQDLNIDSTLQALTGLYVGKQEGMPLHDKVLFVQGYGFHGKNFERIRDLVPNHSLQSLVNHYYTEFKRGKQIKVPGARPETDVRKLANAAALLLVPDVANYRPNILPARPSSGIEDNRNIQELVANRLRLLENTDVDESREVPRMGLPVSKHRRRLNDFHGVVGLDATAITHDDPTGKAEEIERSRIEKCKQARAVAPENLKKAKEGFRLSEENVQQEAIIAAAREEAKKDPTPVWQQEEIMIFMRSLVEFGTDFAKSSLLLPNKTDQQVRIFYYNRAFEYGLDKLVTVYEDKIALKPNANI